MVPKSPSARVRQILSRAGLDAPEAAGSALEREIFRKVLAMGLPSIASFLLLTVYDLVDIFWLARLGEEPVAAVTLFAALLWVLTFANQIIGTGSVAVISRRFGESDHTGTEVAIKNTFLGKFAIGAVMGAVGLLVLRPALEFLGGTPAVVELGVAYGRVQCLGMGVALASFSVYTALRGIGRPTLGMWISVIGTVVNVVLDPVLIFGVGPFPRLGVLGASLASIAGFTTVTVCGLVALAGPRSPIRVRWLSAPSPGGREIVRMARIGLPSGLSALSFAVSSSVVVKLVATYGTTVVALFGMSQKALQFGIMVIVGLGLGTSALIGQYLGSREPHKAWLAAVLSMRVAAAAMLVFGVALAIFAPLIVHAFFGDPEMVGPGALYLRLLAIGLPFIGLSIGVEQAYAGAGRNTPPMIMHLVTSWGLTIPLMLLLGMGMKLGPAGMMAGHSVADLLGAILAVALLRHGGWLEHRV
jgi:putative MATE family efflux protein